MDAMLEAVVDKLLAREIENWDPPIERALQRRQGYGAKPPLGPGEAERVAAWSARHCDRRFERWQRLVTALCGSDGTWGGVHNRLLADGADDEDAERVAHVVTSLEGGDLVGYESSVASSAFDWGFHDWGLYPVHRRRALTPCKEKGADRTIEGPHRAAKRWGYGIRRVAASDPCRRPNPSNRQ